MLFYFFNLADNSEFLHKWKETGVLSIISIMGNTAFTIASLSNNNKKLKLVIEKRLIKTSILPLSEWLP